MSTTLEEQFGLDLCEYCNQPGSAGCDEECECPACCESHDQPCHCDGCTEIRQEYAESMNDLD